MSDDYDDEDTLNNKAYMMDAEFAEIEKQVAIAVAALHTANAIVKKKGYTLRNTPITNDGVELIDTWDLIREIGSGGWRTSSLSC